MALEWGGKENQAALSQHVQLMGQITLLWEHSFGQKLTNIFLGKEEREWVISFYLTNRPLELAQ